MRIAVIQLGRAGDICIILPCLKHLHDQGNEVTLYADPEFIGIVEACSYVKPYVWHSPYPWPYPKPLDAAAHANASGNFDKVIVSQVSPETRPARSFRSYSLALWDRFGLYWNYHDWPLVFDNRDMAAEADFLSLIINDGRPLLSYSFKGYSSGMNWDAAIDMAGWVGRTFGSTHRLLDLGLLRLPKAHFLIPLIEASECLITIDTLPLHLAYATGTPTIQLSNRRPYRTSESEIRSHVVGRWSHDDAMRDDVRAEIERVVREKDFSPGRFVTPLPDPPEHEVVRVGLHDGDCVNDRMSTAMEASGADDIIVLTDSGVEPTPDDIRAIRDAMVKTPCIFCPWMFAVRAWWWETHQDEFPPMNYGGGEWTTLFRLIFRLREQKSFVPLNGHPSFPEPAVNPNYPLQRKNREAAFAWANHVGYRHVAWGDGPVFIDHPLKTGLILGN